MDKLELKNLCFAYGHERTAKKAGQDGTLLGKDDDLALKHIDLKIEEGSFVCLIGHSGCGKTTLLRCLADLQQPTSGAVLIDGARVEAPGMDRSVIFQNYALFPWMTVRRNVEFGVRQASKELGRGYDKERIAAISGEYLEKVGMAKAAERYPYELSGGMRQRVAIARALAMDTDILLFDEPFGALDVKTRRELQDLMDGLWCESSRKRTAIFVTHDIDEALLLADRVVFMTGGRIKESLAVPFPRPRMRLRNEHSEAYDQLHQHLISLFYAADEAASSEDECVEYEAEAVL